MVLLDPTPARSLRGFASSGSPTTSRVVRTAVRVGPVVAVPVAAAAGAFLLRREARRPGAPVVLPLAPRPSVLRAVPASPRPERAPAPSGPPTDPTPDPQSSPDPPRRRRRAARRLLGRLVAGLLRLLGLLVGAGVMGVLLVGLVAPLLVLVSEGGSGAERTASTLPLQLDLEPLAQRSTIVDRSGTPLAHLFAQDRVLVALADVSPSMRAAIVAIEDDRFYEHGALDLTGTLRAMVANQSRGGVVQGGSTITQQLVKLTLLDQASTPAEQAAAVADTYARKITELRYAVGLESTRSKDWILERYLNLAYFGDGAYGVQAAAQHYFGVDAAALDLRQSATLAGLVKNPTGYDPTDHPEAALARRGTVLARMAELGAAPLADVAQAEVADLGLAVTTIANGCVGSVAPFFCAYLMRTLELDPSLGPTPAAREALLMTGGITVETTFDATVQRAADAAVAAHVFPTDDAVGALAVVQPGTGRVLALAQSRPIGTDAATGQTFLNYTVPTELGDAQGFQAGSTFKAFVLGAALEDGVPFTRTYDSPPSKTFDQAGFANCPGEPPFAGDFTVPNSTTSGVKDLVTGTRESVNTYYLQLERSIGVCKPYDLARSLGVRLTSPTGPAAERIPNFTLGVASASPLEMAEAYATFGARGLHCDSRPLTVLRDAGGRVLKRYHPSCQQVMRPRTADGVNAVLRGVQEPGGFGYDLGDTGLRVPSAGKTGTTNDGKSVWFVGYTPRVATAAVIGGAADDGSWLPLAGQTVGGQVVATASGSGFAGPMWADLMHVVDDRLTYRDFVAPPPWVVRGDRRR